MRLAVAVVVALATACDTTVHHGAIDAPVSPSCLEATQHSDFAWIADNVFRPSCALSLSCHSGTRPAGLLNLTAARAYADLVNRPAVGEDGRVRVVPFAPESSYIMVKLGRVPGPLGDDGAGTLMPPNSPPLCAEKLDALQRWIAEGAQGTVPDAGVSDAPVDAPNDAAIDAPVDAGPSE